MHHLLPVNLAARELFLIPVVPGTGKRSLNVSPQWWMPMKVRKNVSGEDFHSWAVRPQMKANETSLV